MASTDAIVASIEAELEELKAAEAAPAPAPAPVEAPVAAPVAKHPNPIIQMAIDQAAERLAKAQ
jgi:hypothetical protein